MHCPKLCPFQCPKTCLFLTFLRVLCKLIRKSTHIGSHISAMHCVVILPYFCSLSPYLLDRFEFILTPIFYIIFQINKRIGRGSTLFSEKRATLCRGYLRVTECVWNIFCPALCMILDEAIGVPPAGRMAGD